MSTPHRQSTRRTSAQTLAAHKQRGFCESCGKKTYFERNHAKDERKRLRRTTPSEVPLSIYRCPSDSTRWHIGHDYDRHADIAEYYDSLEAGA